MDIQIDDDGVDIAESAGSSRMSFNLAARRRIEAIKEARALRELCDDIFNEDEVCSSWT